MFIVTEIILELLQQLKYFISVSDVIRCENTEIILKLFQNNFISHVTTAYDVDIVLILLYNHCYGHMLVSLLFWQASVRWCNFKFWAPAENSIWGPYPSCDCTICACCTSANGPNGLVLYFPKSTEFTKQLTVMCWKIFSRHYVLPPWSVVRLHCKLCMSGSYTPASVVVMVTGYCHCYVHKLMSLCLPVLAAFLTLWCCVYFVHFTLEFDACFVASVVVLSDLTIFCLCLTL